MKEITDNLFFVLLSVLFFSIIGLFDNITILTALTVILPLLIILIANGYKLCRLLYAAHFKRK